MGSVKAFSNKCLNEKGNTSDLIDFETLVERKSIIFDKSSVRYDQVITIPTCALVNLEKANVLSTPVIGKEDAQIGELINKLQNSEWVNSGRKYLVDGDSKCPFCHNRLQMI